MSLNFRFGVISDLHIGLPQTIEDSPHRFHLVELSVSALESALTHLSQLDLDFLLIPGDLTQDGEPDNHTWLSQRLAQLPFPSYVIPGNHDVISPIPTDTCIGLQEFPGYYPKFGYQNPEQLYYTCALLPGVRLIALNSNQFDLAGYQLGILDDQQLAWLQTVLEETVDELVLVMVHHNVLEHLPDQTQNPVGKRYMLDNAPKLINLLQAHNVQLVFTGHLHVQNIAHQNGLYDVTTGSLVSYPHPYRVIQVQQQAEQTQVEIESHRLRSLPDWPDLQTTSRQMMGQRSTRFMTHFLTQPPLNLPVEKATTLAPQLSDFWATVADGDPVLSYPELPEPVQQYFEAFSHSGVADNQLIISLQT
ncbi:3',5'-cyclic adenosine monophosphate phosphodiesterase CpdA [Acaryochloris thomasi RCC1774]|uniref:3',5'-cyclic adenosine monophosphate phosphodiesterase CpdA n=1 Tax=Acaryochloris thomasi RCC1774 TaxID=1764569 RepID=A0A2W1JXW0_9CYAN|nr:metallophosphoesterase [Acaryochloris thomasi]PZD75135.1 3',5'-cyclic adenosine monophosphate phosphodiesterase CpdA [Acaryochloris thomasi RCC1774]